MSGLDHYRALAESPFEGSYPSAEATAALDDELFFQRAVQTYLWALPAMNMYAMKTGLGRAFGEGYNVMSVFEKRMKPNTLITTPNFDTIYGLAFADLSKTGPLVIEAPAGLQALLDDFWHRPLTGPTIGGTTFLGDIGLPGPDQGKGGRYLIVPQSHGDLDTSGYYVYTCPTNGVFIFLRGFFTDPGNLAPGVAAVEGITIRPLDGEAVPMRFMAASDVDADALAPADGGYFGLLDEFIQGEQIDAVDPYMHGVLAALGIRKGTPFDPSDAHRDLLDLAARTGWRMAKNIAGNYDREARALWWADRHWVAHVKTEPDDFMHTVLDECWRDRATGHTDVNSKAHMYINHYGVSTGMMTSVVGKGAKYGNTYKDSSGEFLRGEHSYRLDLPANPPANLFWSVAIYDTETAAGVDAEGQPYPTLNSMADLEQNDDGSFTLWVGPEQPEGKRNWLKTVPGRGWFSLIRWYAPREEFFNRQYIPGDYIRLD